MAPSTGHRDYRHPPQRKSMHARIVRDLGMRIVAGEFKPGERLPTESALLADYEVSRPVLREAFRALEMQGMIESRPGGGRYLRSVMIPEPAPHRLNRLEANRENLLHVWDARESIEVKAAELAARHATAKEIRALVAPLDKLVKLPAADVGSIDFNREFHLVIARATRNPLIEEMMIRLVARSSEIGFKEFFDVEDFAGLMLIHKPIYQAIAKRRPDDARQAMLDHFAALRRTIGA